MVVRAGEVRKGECRWVGGWMRDGQSKLLRAALELGDARWQFCVCGWMRGWGDDCEWCTPV